MIEHFKGCVYVRDMHRVLVPDGALLKPEQFNATYGGHLFTMMPDGTKPTRKAFEAFTECAVHRFPFVNAASFHPEAPFGTILDDGVNIYVPAEVKTAPGDVSRFLSVIERILPVPDDRAIALSWACWVVQNPGRKALWAPVLQGAEGNGKSMLGECIAYAIGQRYVHRPRAKELGSTFNAWQANKLLILVEEIHISDRRELLDDLKPNITQYTLPIRDMQTTEVNKNVPTNWYMTTNHRDAVIKQMFVIDHQSTAGCYDDRIKSGMHQVRLYINGEQKVITVDDFVPQINEMPSCNMTCTAGELWISILEKAFAKLFQGYEKLI
jgi:hypothetical protein